MTRPAATASPTARIVAIGVFSSCVTADTNSERMVSNRRLARAADSVSAKPAASNIRLTVAMTSVRAAPERAASSARSSTTVARAVHISPGRSGGGSSPAMSGSKKSRGNARVLVGASGPAGAGATTGFPDGSEIASRKPESGPWIRVICCVSSGK